MSGGVAAAIASVLVSGVASVALIYIASEKLGSGMASLLQILSSCAQEAHALVDASLRASEKAPSVEVHPPAADIKDAEESVAATFDAITSLAGKVEKLTESATLAADTILSIVAVVGLSASGYAIFLWPRKVMKAYVRHTLLDPVAELADDTPELALSLMYWQTFEYKSETGGSFSFKPLAHVLSSLKLRHPQSPSEPLSALCYAVNYRSEQDVVWLLEHGATPCHEDKCLQTIISRRMHAATMLFLDALKGLSHEETAAIVNLEIEGNTPLSALLDKPQTTPWSNQEFAVLTELQELGALNVHVTRQPKGASQGVSQGATTRTVSLEEIVQQAFIHPRDPTQKKAVLDMLAELNVPELEPGQSHDTFGLQFSHAHLMPVANRSDTKRRPASAAPAISAAAATSARPHRASDAPPPDEASAPKAHPDGPRSPRLQPTTHEAGLSKVFSNRPSP